MFRRTMLFVLIVSSTSTGQTLVERIPDDLKELRQWTWAAHPLGYFEDLNLSADQYDQLFKLKQKSDPSRLFNSKPPQLHRLQDPEYYREQLVRICEILDDRQEQRLAQIMFQRRMSRNEIGQAIHCFASDIEIENLHGKLAQLTSQIEQQKQTLGINLQEFKNRRSDYTQKILKLQQEQWQLQIAWLNKHIGETRTKKLVGDPVPVSMSVQFQGGGTTHNYGSQKANPVTGELVETNHRFPKRPVDVPAGWTVADARNALNAKLTEYEEQASKVSQKLKAIHENTQELMQQKKSIGNNPALRRANGEQFRQAFDLRRDIEAESEEAGIWQKFELDKLRRIVEELGGDPFADREAARIAENAFFDSSRALDCRKSEFQSHLDLNADQCDKLDAIWFDHKPKLFTPPQSDGNGWVGESFANDPNANAAYRQAILEVLNDDQGRKFTQLAFRRLWFSDNPAEAFNLTTRQLTREHRARIDVFAAKLKSANEMNRFLPFGSPRNSRHWIDLDKEFQSALTTIVGDEAAVSLLGEPMKRDPNWKRPVKIPQGMTLERAKQEYETLAKRLDDLKKQGDKMMNPSRVGFDFLAMHEMGKSFERLAQKTKIARRIYEELGGAVDE